MRAAWRRRSDGARLIAGTMSSGMGDLRGGNYTEHDGRWLWWVRKTSPRRISAQLRAVLADAAGYPRVVIGGDMNSHRVGQLARARGFAWPTEHGPRTTWLGRWDHIFLKGLASPASSAADTVLDVRGASDHRAVWAVAVLP